MEYQMKNGVAGHDTAYSNTLPKITKPVAFPQEPILWQMHCECVRRVQDDPSPVNRMISKIIAKQWQEVFHEEVCR